MTLALNGTEEGIFNLRFLGDVSREMFPREAKKSGLQNHLVDAATKGRKTVAEESARCKHTMETVSHDVDRDRPTSFQVARGLSRIIQTNDSCMERASL